MMLEAVVRIMTAQRKHFRQREEARPMMRSKSSAIDVFPKVSDRVIKGWPMKVRRKA